jgi:hypothetical protein
MGITAASNCLSIQSSPNTLASYGTANQNSQLQQLSATWSFKATLATNKWDILK